jgi:hypothetical protein
MMTKLTLEDPETMRQAYAIAQEEEQAPGGVSAHVSWKTTWSR